jgi:hypothetical protein
LTFLSRFFDVVERAIDSKEYGLEYYEPTAYMPQIGRPCRTLIPMLAKPLALRPFRTPVPALVSA